MHIYFASDFHLGIASHASAKEREAKVVRWLQSIEDQATHLYLVGDLFDFWFEYKKAVPRGYIRFLGQLARMRDKGLPIEIFTGNHDMWMFDYLEQELDLTIHREPIVRKHGAHTFYIGHGDGLGPGDYGYKRLKKVFAHPLAQWLFARLHPNFAFSIAEFWSQTSRKNNKEARTFLGPEEEWLVQYVEGLLQKETYDFWVFGHRHLTIDYTLSNGHSRYINLGEWMHQNSFGHYDGHEFAISFFENPTGTIFP